MRLIGRHCHRSLQQLWDMQIGKDSGLQAQCTAKAHQSRSAFWGCCLAVRLSTQASVGPFCGLPACMGSRSPIVASRMHLGDFTHMKVAVSPSGCMTYPADFCQAPGLTDMATGR